MNSWRQSLPPPIQETFLNNTDLGAQVAREVNYVYFVKGVDFPDEGGMFTHMVNVPYPKKGFPISECVAANNTVKRVTLMLFKNLASKNLLGAYVGFFLTPWKYKLNFVENLIEDYLRVTEWVYEPYFLKEKYYMKEAKELAKWVYWFLFYLGIKETLCKRISEIVKPLIEYDDTYRFRVEDLISVMILKNLLASPSKEMRRVAMIYQERARDFEGNSTKKKFEAFFKVLGLGLRIPRVKSAFIKSLNHVDLQNIQLDKADYYHTMQMEDYNYRGKDYKTRYAEFISFHNGKPPKMMKVENGQILSDEPVPNLEVRTLLPGQV